MDYIQGESRIQQSLFPAVLDDYVKPESPVRFIDAFVDGLDMFDLGFLRPRPNEMGRPSYNPRDLLKLYVYGYLNSIRHSRKLERESQRNVEVMWLLGKLSPDFKTIADFRRDNKSALAGVFREFNSLCGKLDLFGGELVGIDGSKFRAVNGKKRNYSEVRLQHYKKEIDKRIEQYLRQMDENDEGDEKLLAPPLTKEQVDEKIRELREHRKKHTNRLKDLRKSGNSQLSLTDSDSRSMKVGQGTEVSFNVQIAVDGKNKLIVANDVTNEAVDSKQLTKMSLKAKQALGVNKLQVIADNGYYSGKEIYDCERNNIEVYVPEKDKVQFRNEKRFGKSDFRYNKSKDTYTCPKGNKLHYSHTEQVKNRKVIDTVRIYRANGCNRCSLKPKCTKHKWGKRLQRREYESILEKARQRLRGNREKYALRMQLVEHPFGTLKRWMNMGYFLTKGLSGVRAESSLSCLVYNMKRVFNIVDMPTLIAAVS